MQADLTSECIEMMLARQDSALEYQRAGGARGPQGEGPGSLASEACEACEASEVDRRHCVADLEAGFGKGCGGVPGGVHQTSPIADMLQASHDRLYSRLFSS